MGQGRAKIWVALVLLVGVMGYLLYSTTKSTQVYYLKPSEMLSKVKKTPTQAYGQRLRVGGLVVDKSISGGSARNKVSFRMADERGDYQTKLILVSIAETKPTDSFDVEYKGIVPDTFKAGGMAIVEGKLQKNGVFKADTLLAKCPSKYQGVSKTK